MGSPSEEEQQEVVPCPECDSTKGYSRVGDYRVQCKGCNGLLRNEEVNMQLSETEK